MIELLNTTRRGFLKIILASSIAPAIVRASSLMPTHGGIIVPANEILLPEDNFIRLDGAARMSGASWGDIQSGKAISVSFQGITYKTYRMTS